MKLIMGVLIIFAIILWHSCQHANKELYVYNWADYMAPNVITQFENRYNCRVILDTFDSNESMYAKLKAGARGYDIIFPSTYKIQLMIDQNMIQILNHTLLPDLKNIDPTYLPLAFDQHMRYSVPYALSITAIAYLKNRVTNVIPSWKMYDRKDLRDRMTMLNDYREVIGAALMVNGKNVNTLDDLSLEQARDQALRWKKNLAKFENEQYKTGLASEEFFLIQGFSGDILQIQRENPNIDYFVPEEGAIIAMDEIAIASDSKNVELAHAFINFLLEPQMAAANIEYINFLCPNQAAYPLLNDAWRKNPILFPSEHIRSRLQTLKDLGEENVKYTRIWDQIKAGE